MATPMLTFGYEQRSFFVMLVTLIVADDFTKTVWQHHAEVSSSFFHDPQQVACEIDILNIQSSQDRGSKAQGSQQHYDNEIFQAKGRAFPVGEVAN